MFAAATMPKSTAAARRPASNDNSARAEPIEGDGAGFAAYVDADAHFAEQTP
jgi:hypothetical protein